MTLLAAIDFGTSFGGRLLAWGVAALALFLLVAVPRFIWREVRELPRRNRRALERMRNEGFGGTLND